jgi:hypothetical protein
LNGGHHGAFLLDISTGDVVRLDDGAKSVTAVAMSRDGSRLAWIAWVDDEEVVVRAEVRTALRANLEEVQLVAAEKVMVTSPIAVSSDGSQLAFVADMTDLYVIRPDGSDRALVSGREEKRVVALLGMTLTF